MQAMTFFAAWWANGRLERRSKRQLAARDMAIDIVGLVQGAEPALSRIRLLHVQKDVPALRLALNRYAFRWTISRPASDLRAFLATQDDPHIHRAAMLLYDRLRLFETANKRHGAACRYLLDCDSAADLGDPSIAERVSVLNSKNRELRRLCWELLRYAYELLDRLVDTSPSLITFLSGQYSLNQDEIKARRAYYGAAYRRRNAGAPAHGVGARLSNLDGLPSEFVLKSAGALLRYRKNSELMFVVNQSVAFSQNSGRRTRYRVLIATSVLWRRTPTFRLEPVERAPKA